MEKDLILKEIIAQNKHIAISVKNVSKTFRIPHEKVSSVRGAVVSAFKSGGYEILAGIDKLKEKSFFEGIIGCSTSGANTIVFGVDRNLYCATISLLKPPALTFLRHGGF